MADEMKVKVPDIGGASGVDVIEVLVKPGDDIAVDTPLITLESDKASMEIPSPSAGKVVELLVKVGDKISEGDVILALSTESKPETEQQTPTEASEPPARTESPKPTQSPSTETVSQSQEITIPDIGGATDVDVIEVMVSAGDTVKKDQALITLEGDKATMDIPSPFDGEIEKLALKVGDKVSQGSVILTMKTTQAVPVSAPSEKAQPTPPVATQTGEATKPAPAASAPMPLPAAANNAALAAGPAVRRMAREFGVNLSEVAGSGRKNRITKEDVQQYIKSRLNDKPAAGAGGFSLPQAPVIDFSKFGAIETQPLNKIKRLTGQNVHRAWITIPHVTQFDEADITDLEAFRKEESERASQNGYKLTILAFVAKAVTKALMAFPQFNASLDASGENLIYKKYFNIGIAVETPNGLVVPVIRQVDQLQVSDIAREMAAISKKARDKGLMPADMSGGCFTISSLGGIGGTAFTPIVNSPEVAILGLSRSSIKPIHVAGEFKPRLMLPLSLSYDHRVIDGAEAARFTRYLADLLGDIRRILL
ncbi:dihydrolipoyllysine-residue acetyltransferase [Legionella taurinensis]|uniref:Acetyltransferase component of pyruvate dehydrogenase complex n=1 Tax=Legionella taurinensis TaxID=70611 RepID=A0AB38N881_9GAMM|nr:dihydrolipoyllysine-residue acetyltransferase [Legionella taurinensis]MDX1837149.1 dihydrolipoyllysine-residue acetyltransferase [Legionella taurinensis]PUT40453.1 dihydrolipoyllysine-residue acetyltransferase [Legionella taurinensis]PUT40556.1 dihydrolipoyllysine-residue acetyltransferase [Legionella taurinensis]PUT42801.1 dihydrolipoyllysine-residue acetyltransferase [Legionella taurinensis]PUT48516.1 dihydrolipoyllysine-residue acetyltransferase [Legionella taurinensis]